MTRTTITTRPDPIVTLAEAKVWLRVDHTADDDLIEDIIIPSAQAKIEAATGLSLSSGMELKVEFTGLDSEQWMELPYAPVIEVTAPAGSTVSGDTILIPAGDTIVEYEAGFTDCPPDLKLCVLNQITWDYDNRGSSELAPNAKGTVLLHTRNLMF